MAKKGYKVEIKSMPTRPIIIEPAKPANGTKMNEQEVDALVEEMVEALMGKE